jgi:signal transduction histidine kinase/DNA-binding response OmpR family regulator
MAGHMPVLHRLSIARSLRLVLLGLTLAVAAIAGLGVAGLYDARQTYEDELARSYELELTTSRLTAATVAADAALAAGGPDAGLALRRATRAFDTQAARALDLARGDPGSAAALRRWVAAQEQARARPRDRRAAARSLATARRSAASVTTGQAARRERARDEAADDTRTAVITIAVAGVLTLLGALALVAALVTRMRRPLDELVDATGRLAAGEAGGRVKPTGPRELRELGTAFNAMAADLDAARERIETERRKLATTIASLGEALVVCDADGAITDLNPRARELLPQLELGQRADTAGSPLPAREEAMRGEVTVESGGRSLAVTAAPFGSLREGVVWTVRDISERARLERLKSEFVATASHELRSPLTSIKGFVELLERSDGMSERQREFVEVISMSTNRLVDLVNDLLDVARVEAGRMEIHRRPVDMGEVAREVARMLEPRVVDKRQQLEVRVEPALPRGLADPSRVRQILTNLLTNAHLYTPEGGHLSVRVSAEPRSVRVAVADDGPGIPPEEVEQLFDRFYRGRGGAGSGTGLGLSIVKSLVDLHGGSIEAQSRQGAGTTFVVKLPREPSRPSRAEAEPRAVLKGKRVLVVEDEPAVAQLIAVHLTPYDVEAVLVHSGEEALDWLRGDDRGFDAVTLDILMPGMSGFEVLAALRADPDLAETPVVVVSVLAGRQTLAGEWTVAKPIDADDLADALGTAVAAGRTRVLVVGRSAARERLGPALERIGLDHEWVTSGAAAARVCEEQRFEVALVDAGMRSPQAVMRALDLRGRREGRSVIVFSTGDDAPGAARFGAEPLPVEEAADAVLAALRDGRNEA